jgi:NAD(P)-dependent dehydrogenase (short-subunit alcohol dehydrogenase family)
VREFKEKVAVITGAASGIGLAIAEHCAREGMNVVLADVEESALSRAEQALKAAGATACAVRTDVSKAAEVEALAKRALDRFGGVHLLVNNAGVGAGGSIWESSLADWEWVIGVNLWGVIHGMRTFVPVMLAQDTDCHIVNTASVAGLLPFHPGASYHATKHAVVALSEQLYHSLAQRKAKVRASVLCPGAVSTQIMDSGRNRPPELRNKPGGVASNPEREAMLQTMRDVIAAGMSPRQVAEHVFRAIREERLYILTHPDWNEVIQQRASNIVQQRNPA